MKTLQWAAWRGCARLKGPPGKRFRCAAPVVSRSALLCRSRDVRCLLVDWSLTSAQERSQPDAEANTHPAHSYKSGRPAAESRRPSIAHRKTARSLWPVIFVVKGGRLPIDMARPVRLRPFPPAPRMRDHKGIQAATASGAVLEPGSPAGVHRRLAVSRSGVFTAVGRMRRAGGEDYVSAAEATETTGGPWLIASTHHRTGHSDPMAAGVDARVAAWISIE